MTDNDDRLPRLCVIITERLLLDENDDTFDEGGLAQFIVEATRNDVDAHVVTVVDWHPRDRDPGLRAWCELHGMRTVFTSMTRYNGMPDVWVRAARSHLMRGYERVILADTVPWLHEEVHARTDLTLRTSIRR